MLPPLDVWRWPDVIAAFYAERACAIRSDPVDDDNAEIERLLVEPRFARATSPIAKALGTTTAARTAVRNAM